MSRPKRITLGGYVYHVINRTVLRYIEANPLHAAIVDNPNNYFWSSFAARKGLEKPFGLSDSPVILPANWPQLVNRNIDATVKSPKNVAKTNYLPVRQHCQRSKIKGTKYF